MEPYTEDVERLCTAAEALPRLVDDAVQGTATIAAVLSEYVQNLDARRRELNELALRLGERPIPDVVTAAVPSSDPVRARVIAAARRGAAETAVGIGKAARRPACQPDAAASIRPGTGVGGSARAAAALLAWTHHKVADVEPQDLVAGADPVHAAMLLAGIALNLAADVFPDEDAIAAWITRVGAAWALDGD